MIEVKKIISFLGRDYNDYELVEYLEENNIFLNSELLLIEGTFNSYVERHEDGYCLIFTTEARFLSKEDWYIGRGRMFLIGIFLYSEGRENYSEYKGEIPFGVHFSQERDNILKKMGEPNWQRLSLDEKQVKADRWHIDFYRMHITYSRETQKPVVISISISIPIPDKD